MQKGLICTKINIRLKKLFLNFRTKKPSRSHLKTFKVTREGNKHKQPSTFSFATSKVLKKLTMDKPRNFYKNTFHHIYNRGAFQKNIFYDKADYDYFLRKLKEYRDKYYLEILCYCLMPNHYHLFIKQTKEEYSVSKFIADFSNSFTKGINKKYKRSGVLFEGKTKSKLIADDSYFKWVIKYILENPVKAKLVNNCFDYEYSSAKEIMGSNEPIITSVNELLSFFDSKKSFNDFMLDKSQKYSYEF